MAFASAQICETHNGLLRLRGLRLQTGGSTGSTLWTWLWLTCVGLRALPHLGLLYAFVAAHGLTGTTPSTRFASQSPTDDPSCGICPDPPGVRNRLGGLSLGRIPSLAGLRWWGSSS